MLSSVGEFKYQSRKYEILKPRQANEATTGEIDSSKIVPSDDAIKYVLKYLSNHNQGDESCLGDFEATDVCCNLVLRRVYHSSCSHFMILT